MNHRLITSLALGALLLWSLPTDAQDVTDRIASKTLANGLDVVVIPSGAVPLATIEICVRNGAFTETPELNGLSHLFEHMFFKGNAVLPDQKAYLARTRELGMQFNGTTSEERVNYYFTLPAENLEAGLVFMRDAITTLKFDKEELTKEKKVVLGEVDRNESSPYYEWMQAIDRAAWGEHFRRKDALGDRTSIENATTEQMQTMKSRYYVPNNSGLFVSGDVEPEAVFALADKVFGSWKKAPDPHKKWPIPKYAPLKKNSHVVAAAEKMQVPAIQFTWHGPSVDDDPKATFAADVLSFILRQPTSKFYKALVDSGVTLGAGLSYYTQRYTGPITLSAGVEPNPAKLEAAVGALLAELEQFTLPGYYTDEQLESAKTLLAIDDLYGREDISSFTHSVSFWWATASLDYYRNYIENLRAVTRADINAYVTKYLLGKPFVAAVVVPKGSPLEALMTAKRFEELVAQAQTSKEGAK